MNTYAIRAREFFKSEDGPTATEYAVMLALVIVALVATITAFKDKVQGLFTTIGAAVG